MNNQNKIEKLISELCPNGVEIFKLSEITKITIGEFVHKNKQNPNGEYPVLNGGISETGFYDEFNNTANKIVISARGANAGYVNKIFKPYWAGNSCYTIDVINKSKINWIFVFYYLKNNQNNLIGEQQKGGIPAVSKKQIENFKIPIPPLPIQEEIVKILNSFTELEAELEAELGARKKQYEHYRKELMLSYSGENKTLDDIYDFQYGEGNTIPTTGGEYPVYGGNSLAGRHDKYNSEDAPVIGHIGAYAGIVNWVNGKHFVTYNGVICKIKSGVNPKFGYHLLVLQDFRSKANAGSQPFVSYDM